MSYRDMPTKGLFYSRLVFAVLIALALLVIAFDAYAKEATGCVWVDGVLFCPQGHIGDLAGVEGEA